MIARLFLLNIVLFGLVFFTHLLVSNGKNKSKRTGLYREEFVEDESTNDLNQKPETGNQNTAAIEKLRRDIDTNTQSITELTRSFYDFAKNATSNITHFTDYFLLFNESFVASFETEFVKFLNKDLLYSKRDLLRKVVLQSLTKTDLDEPENQDNDISYQILDVVEFLFSVPAYNKSYSKMDKSLQQLENSKSAETTLEKMSSTMTKSRHIVQYEVADYFNIAMQDVRASELYESLKLKNSDFFFTKLSSFVAKNIGRDKSDKLVFKDLSSLKRKWLEFYPNHIVYEDFEKKMKIKFGMFAEQASEVFEQAE